MTADSDWIVDQAVALGFELCGVVRAEKFPELEQFQNWLKRGYAGEMNYLEDPKRQDPGQVMENARSAIVCALNYNTAYLYSTEARGHAAHDDEPRGWISRYAWGDDYHEVMWEKLNALTTALRERIAAPFTARAYADTGPIAERVFAKYAGLGWLGKNTLLLNETLGSWLFLGVVLTSLELSPSLGPGEQPPADLCGNCRQCLDACPTGALVEPYVLDARKCISYLTIEYRGTIPEELPGAMGWHVYGCDICQDVCPYNRHAPVTELKRFLPRKIPGKQMAKSETLFEPSLEWLAGMNEEEFREGFRGSAMKRAKWAGLVRNACVALGNSRVQPHHNAYRRIVSLLERLTNSETAVIAESAQKALWSIKRERL
jgi:epoxyqueuosine reductase